MNAGAVAHDWVIAADDRTGALEMAAEMAVVFGVPVPVWVEHARGSGVVDLGSRSLDPAAAAARAAAIDAAPAGWSAHKIDSTLRGNWAAELSSRLRATGRPVVLLPAWPAMGRTCRDGVVHVHGQPVAAVRSSVPSARAVSLDEVEALAADEVVWVDIEHDVDLHAAAAAVGRLDVLVAGPAGALGAVARTRFAGDHPQPVCPELSGPVLVVCGSATAVSMAQVAALAAARPDVEIVAAEPARGSLSPSVAAGLAAAVRPRLSSFAVVVVVGGDTAAAVLGDAPRSVGGYAAPGMPWSRALDGTGPLVVTKAGGFGDVAALVHLLAPSSLG